MRPPSTTMPSTVWLKRKSTPLLRAWSAKALVKRKQSPVSSMDRRKPLARQSRAWARLGSTDASWSAATDEGWVFLAVVIDLFSRQVVGWSLREEMAPDIVIDALRMAWFKRHPGK